MPMKWMPDKSVLQRDRLGMTKYYRQVSHIKSGSLLFDESPALSRKNGCKYFILEKNKKMILIK